MPRNEYLKHVFLEHGVNLHIAAGDYLMQKGEPNERLFWVRSGQFHCIESPNFDGKTDALCGLLSFYSKDVHANVSLQATENSTVTYIEASDFFSSYDEKSVRDLTRLIILELSKRNEQILELEMNEERQNRKIREMESLAVLGQLSAGVAHELNNAFAVIDRGIDWLENRMTYYVDSSRNGLEKKLFEIGRQKGRRLALSSNEQKSLREISKHLQKKYNLTLSDARSLAQLNLPVELLEQVAFSKSRPELINSWETGATLRDLDRAAKQTSHVVKSMRELGAQHGEREVSVNITETINSALSILQNPLKNHKVEFEGDNDLELNCSPGMLIQVFINIIKNACDAMQDIPAGEGMIRILCFKEEGQLFIDIANNGPEIPADILPQIFNPNVTTKKNGLSFGLGIGLTFVKRIIEEYGGTVSVESSSENTVFHLNIPFSN